MKSRKNDLGRFEAVDNRAARQSVALFAVKDELPAQKVVQMVD